MIDSITDIKHLRTIIMVSFRFLYSDSIVIILPFLKIVLNFKFLFLLEAKFTQLFSFWPAPVHFV